MADDKSKSGEADRIRINVNERYELEGWTRELGVTSERLKELVKKYLEDKPFIASQKFGQRPRRLG